MWVIVELGGERAPPQRASRRNTSSDGIADEELSCHSMCVQPSTASPPVRNAPQPGCSATGPRRPRRTAAVSAVAPSQAPSTSSSSRHTARVGARRQRRRPDRVRSCDGLLAAPPCFQICMSIPLIWLRSEARLREVHRLPHRASPYAARCNCPARRMVPSTC
jgi:hypothetical protein